MTNLLLHAINGDASPEFECLQVELRAGQCLQRSGEPQAYAYFPISAVISMVSTMSKGGSVQIAMVGREGFSGLADVLHNHLSHTDDIVHVPGSAVRAATAGISAVLARDVRARAIVDRFTTARLSQVSRIAACNRLHPIGARLARWLLATQDRAQIDTFQFPQQHIADMLGVHRPTIAAELQRLHATRAISYRGRRLTIADREMLETLACECRVTLRREYQELCELLSDPRRLKAFASGYGDRRTDDSLDVIAHELRTRIHAILGWCELAAGSSPPAEAIPVIRRNARAQLSLIDDLLDAGENARLPTPTSPVRRSR